MGGSTTGRNRTLLTTKIERYPIPLTKQQLQQVFSNGEFGDRSSNFSGGSSLDVSWTNGPTTAAVEAIAKQHQSIAYDEASGEVLLGGNRDVACHRFFSLNIHQEAVEAVCNDWCLKLSVTITKALAPTSLTNTILATLPLASS